MRVAVIGGLGLMASPMAKHWKDKEAIKVVRVHDRGTLSPRRDKCREAWRENGAQIVSSLEELVGEDNLDGVFVCAGKNGDDLPIISVLANRLSANSKGAFICHLSTVSTSFVKAAHEYCLAKGIHYVNYPLTGGPSGAEKANMLILAGGDYDIYQKLVPVLSLLGKPKYFGPNVTAGTEVKLIGHLMVFNNLIGLCSAVAAHTESLNHGVFGGEDQIAFMEFLNEGAGGSKQWEIALSNGLKRDEWNIGFPVKYAVVDAIYAVKMCLDLQIAWLCIQPIVNAALAFSFLLHKVDAELCTHAIAREMVAERTLSLDQFLMQHSAPAGESALAIEKCIDSLPEEIKNSVALKISVTDFNTATLQTQV